MLKEHKKYENQKCKCGHYRSTHSEIIGLCYHPDCDCIKFELLE